MENKILKSEVIEKVVDNDLCVGCGLCVYKCHSSALEMDWDENGFLIPKQIKYCDCDGSCIEVCPFNPLPKKEVRTEDEIAEIFLKDADKYEKGIGKYVNLYVGYSNQFRMTSSSGGLATYITAALLEKGIVNHVFSIKESSDSKFHYEYSIISNSKDVLNSSKTRYYPVTLSKVLSEINRLEGKVAITGIGCFIKAIRLAQKSDPVLNEKIAFLIGIICGGLKSRFFTEYLASKMEIEAKDIKKPEYREKNIISTAYDYSFSSQNNKNERKSIRMQSIGDMWGTGLFKANACDFCDDVTTELADISLGDAWLHPYYLDGKGTSLIVTRSKLAEKLMIDGIENMELMIEPLSKENFLVSQQGGFNHRHKGLPARIKIAKQKNMVIPPKRYTTPKTTPDFALVQKQRMKTRKMSLEVWKNTCNAKEFDEIMAQPLAKLQKVTKIYHRFRKLRHYKKRVFEILQKKLNGFFKVR